MAAHPKHPPETSEIVAFCIIAALLLLYGFLKLNWSFELLG
jgi:hypothetical protein